MEKENENDKEKDKLYENSKKSINIFGKEEDKKKLKQIEDEER